VCRGVPLRAPSFFSISPFLTSIKTISTPTVGGPQPKSRTSIPHAHHMAGDPSKAGRASGRTCLVVAAERVPGEWVCFFPPFPCVCFTPFFFRAVPCPRHPLGEESATSPRAWPDGGVWYEAVRKRTGSPVLVRVWRGVGRASFPNPLRVYTACGLTFQRSKKVECRRNKIKGLGV